MKKFLFLCLFLVLCASANAQNFSMSTKATVPNPATVKATKAFGFEISCATIAVGGNTGPEICEQGAPPSCYTGFYLVDTEVTSGQTPQGFAVITIRTYRCDDPLIMKTPAPTPKTPAETPTTPKKKGN